MPTPGYDRVAGAAAASSIWASARSTARIRRRCSTTALAAGDLRWGIVGVVACARPAVRDALAPQDGLYTRGGARTATQRALRVIGAVLDVLVAPEDPEAVRGSAWPRRTRTSSR